MSVSDDDLYDDLSLIGEPVLDKDGVQDSPNKSSELHLFEEYIISKETEKATKKLSDLTSDLKKAEAEIKSLRENCTNLKDDNITLLKNISSLWKTAIVQIRDKDKKIRALEKEKEAIIFRRAVRQISKDELDRVVSRIAAYNKEEFKEFLKVLNLRNNEDTKVTQERIAPRVSYKSSSAIRESVLGTRVSARSHSLAHHLERLQDGNKIRTMKESDKQAGDCDSRKKSPRIKLDKASSDKHSGKEQRRNSEFKAPIQCHRSTNESINTTNQDDRVKSKKEIQKKSSNTISLGSGEKNIPIPDLDRFSDSRDDSDYKRRLNETSEEGNSKTEYPFTHLRSLDNPKRSDLEEGELTSNDENTKDGSEMEPQFKEPDKSKELVDTQPRVNDIRAWRIPKIKKQKSIDGKENELTESQEKHLKDVHTRREKSYKTLSEKNDGRHLSKTRNVGERSSHTREKRSKKQDRPETERRSPRKRKRDDSNRSNYKNFDHRRKSEYISRSSSRRADLETHRIETRRERTSKNYFSKDIENVRSRNYRSVSRQPHCSIYKLRRMRRELKESNQREHGSCRSRNHSRERGSKRKSPIKEVTTNIKKHCSPHGSGSSRRSRSDSCHRSQSTTKSDKEKLLENYENQDSKSSSSKSDYKQKETLKSVSVETSKHREYSDKKDRKYRESSEKNNTIKNNSSSDKSRDTLTDKKLERRSKENSDVEIENVKPNSQNKEQKLDEGNVEVGHENETRSIEDHGEKISSIMENNITHLEYEKENDSPHILPSTTDPSHFQFDVNFPNVCREEGEHPNIANGNSDIKAALENEQLRFDVVQAVSTQPIIENTSVQESSPCISDDKPKNERHKLTSRPFSVFSDSESSLAFSFNNNNSKEKGSPEEEDTFDGFILKQKELQREPSMLQNDDSEMSLLKYIGINVYKQKSEQNSLTFIAVSPPSIVLPLKKSPTKQVDNGKLQKTFLSSEVGSDKTQETSQSSEIGRDKSQITSQPSEVDKDNPRETFQSSEVGSDKSQKISQSAEVDSDKNQKNSQSPEVMVGISKDLSEPISKLHFLARQDYLSPVCSIPPGESFLAPTPTSRLPYSLNALQSMETPYKTLSTSSCSPILAATPLDLSGDATHISTPPPLSSTLKFSTPVVVFDLDKNPTFVRDKAQTLVTKISQNEVGGSQPINASLPSPVSVPTSDEFNIVLDLSRNRQNRVDGNMVEENLSSHPITPHDSSSNSEKKSVSPNESEKKKKVPFITISNEISRKGELFSNHEQYGFASSFYKNLDEFEHDWPSHHKINDNSKKPPSKKSPQEKCSRLMSSASASSTTDSDSGSSSSSSSSCSGSSSSSSSNSSSSSATTGTRSSNSGSGSTSLGKNTENNSNSVSQNDPLKTSFKNVLTFSPQRKNDKSLDKKQSPKKQLSSTQTSLISQASERNESHSDKTSQMKSQSSKSPAKKRTRRIKPTPVPRDSGSELSLILSNFEESHSSSFSSAIEYFQDFSEMNSSDHNMSSNKKTPDISLSQSKSSKKSNNNVNCIVGVSSPKESFKALLNDPIISDPSILSAADSQTPKSKKICKGSSTNSLIKNNSNVSVASADISQKLSEIPCSSVVSEAQDKSRFEDKHTPLQALSQNVSTNSNKSSRSKTPKRIKIITPETVIVVTNKSKKRARSLTPSSVENVISIVYTGEEKSNTAEGTSNSSDKPYLRRSPRKKRKTNIFSTEESENDKGDSICADQISKLKSSEESKSKKENTSNNNNCFKIYRPIKRKKVTLAASSTSSASVK